MSFESEIKKKKEKATFLCQSTELTITEKAIMVFTTTVITFAEFPTVMATTHTLATLTDAVSTANQRAIVRSTRCQHVDDRVRITLLHTLAVLTQIPFITANKHITHTLYKLKTFNYKAYSVCQYAPTFKSVQSNTVFFQEFFK